MKYFTCVFILALATIAVPVPVQQPPPLCREELCSNHFIPLCGLLEHEGQKISQTFTNKCMFIQMNCVYPLTPYVQIGDVGQTCHNLQLENSCTKSCAETMIPVCGLRWDIDDEYMYFDSACDLWQGNCLYPDMRLQQVGEPGEVC